MSKKETVQKVQSLLQGWGLKIEDSDYEGVKVDVHAQNNDETKNIFVYVNEDNKNMINLGHIMNLNNIQKFNNDNNKSKCNYVVISHGMITDSAKKGAKQKNIHVYDEVDQFKDELPTLVG